MQIKKITNLTVKALMGIAVMTATIHPAAATIKVNPSDIYRPTNTSTPDKAEVATEMVEAKVLKVEEPTALDLWLEKLAQKESEGRERIKILDVNGKYSYGCLQFQEWTFRTYGAKYGLVSPKANLESVIYDCNLQKKIAKHMISEDYKMWQSWYTSVMVRNLGLPPRS